MSDNFKPVEGSPELIKIPNGTKKRVVVCAANRFTNKQGDEVLICGARHWDKIMHVTFQACGGIDELTPIPNTVANQGFIDQQGIWMGRQEAREVVQANGQTLSEFSIQGDELFSENLYL